MNAPSDPPDGPPPPPPPPSGPRIITSKERRVIADALRRAAADTRTVLDAWNGPIRKAVYDQALVDNNRQWLEALSAYQEQLARELENPAFELRLENRTAQ